ncbi:MAG: hypothetical protein F6K00_34240 [Leptolyngbya sp. SIOISBB]|nr:hypothetical protein [Leptolyngbya sp. SIOISBB]
MVESIAWRPVGAVDPCSLVEARNQAHHALQIPALAAIAFVPPRDDFSHINFGWLDQHSAFVSHPIPTAQDSVQFGLRLADLTLLILVSGELHLIYPMHGRTHQEATDWLVAEAAKWGLPTDKFNDHAPADMPYHPVANGSAYDVESHAQAMAEFCNYYGNANLVLARVRETYLDIHPGPNEIRMWPHHFDIAVLVTMEAGDPETAKAFGFGFEPGDHTCEQPYFYTYPWPRSQRPEALPGLSLGAWTEPGTWLGTWLKGEAIAQIPAADQQAKVEAYLREGADQCRMVAINHP